MVNVVSISIIKKIRAEILKFGTALGQILSP